MTGGDFVAPSAVHLCCARAPRPSRPPFSCCGLHFIRELLDPAGAEADHLGDLADAVARRQELPSFARISNLIAASLATITVEAQISSVRDDKSRDARA